jgi:hypothetical protein
MPRARNSSRLVSRVVRGASCVALAGCAEVLDIPDSPELVGRWSCLNTVVAPLTPVVSFATVTVRACDFFATDCSTPVTGLQARLCRKDDATCAEPLSEPFADAGGVLTFSVPTDAAGFDGYLEVSSATELCTNPSFGEDAASLCDLFPECQPDAPDERCAVPIYARARLFFNPPVVSDAVEPIWLRLVPAATIPTLARAAGAGTLDPTTGNLFITTVDCEGKPASGVRYTIGEYGDQVTELYMDGTTPSDVSRETDDSGLGGFLGVPPGPAEVYGYNERYEKVGETGVQTAPFTISYAFIVPSP